MLNQLDGKKNNDDIVVSVHVIVYNQRDYVLDCLESIVDQKCDFRFEIIIGDDASPDGTQELIKSFIEKHKDKDIIPVLASENVGAFKNHLRLFKRSRGKYIAMCEGDDYWKDPYKLQKQVNFLENNPDCVVCHTWQSYLFKKDEQWVIQDAPKENSGYLNQVIGDVSLVLKNELRLKSRTLMFRNEITIPQSFRKVPYGDIAFSILLGKYGKYGFVDTPTAVYRIHDEGLSTVNKYKGFRWVYDRFNLIESMYYARDVFGDTYDSLLKKFYQDQIIDILSKSNINIKFWRELNSRINSFCDKYELKKSTFKILTFKIWLRWFFEKFRLEKIKIKYRRIKRRRNL